MAIKTFKKWTSGRISENFGYSEFQCKGSSCCSEFKVDEKLVEIVQKIRDHFGKPLIINSAYRCPTHNKRVGGVDGSYHTKGMAADIRVVGIKPAEVAKYAEEIGVLGIGLYDVSDGEFVHVDTRTSKAFWYGHKQEYRSTFGGAVKKVDYCTEHTYLRQGSKGDAVKALQILLIGRGYSCGKYGADGDFGAGTKAAVVAFQKANSLDADGVVGKETMPKLLGI